LSHLGPGLITGAADDDPSAIATYSIAGAQFGTSVLWTALITWPLMAGVQMMCARIGVVTNKGIAGALYHKFPRSLVAVGAFALLIANTVNVGTDLSGMADAAEMLTGINSHYFVVLFGVTIGTATVWFHYRQIVNILKWLAASLLAYAVTAFVVRPDWASILRDTFIPTWPTGHSAWATMVAILGTTISPYLFFWQASQEVEEKKAMGRPMVLRPHQTASAKMLGYKQDVAVGTLFSNLVMYFIMLTTAVTLHVNGVTNIETSQQAAAALQPLAGRFAATVFTLGIIGVGFLAIPTLTGSAAYALAETFCWRRGLGRKLKSARAFYGVIILSTAVGIILDFANVSPIRALFWTAILNGFLAPFLLIGILIVACDQRIMRRHPSSLLGRVLVVVTALVMLGVATKMFL
jgi:NRAMP (natural resistance-associated macrophage protein)-like metal ion transporter